MLGKFQAAAEDFEHAHRAAPDNQYNLIWEYLARTRTGQDWRKNLNQITEDKADRKWPYPIIDFLAGRLSRDKLIATANDPDTTQRRNRQCEVWTYLGELELAHAKTNSARHLFQRAKDTCSASFTESDVARAELARLAAAVGGSKAID